MIKRIWYMIPKAAVYIAIGILIGQLLGAIGTVYTMLAACAYLKR